MEQTEVDLIIMEARVKGIGYKRLAATPRLTTTHLLEYKQRWSSVVNLMRNLFRMSYTLMQCNLFYTIITIYKKYQVLWEKKIAPSTLPSTLPSTQKIMERIDIQIPKGVRYMSDYPQLTSILPQHGRFILNKQLTGCGGTTLFLHNEKPLVLISPRTNILISKYNQTPNSHLFRDKKSADVYLLKEQLRKYMGYCKNPFRSVIPKILVTVDSFKYVLEVLAEYGITDDFLFVVDEFQNLVSDATFKGKTDMEFLSLIDNHCSNIVYMSATPVPAVYLDSVQQFKGLKYYMLNWDPNILETPNIKEVQMKSSYNTLSICTEIISKFREKGYFERKVYNGQVCYAREICIFLNEVKTIKQIIVTNNLQPSEVTILVSENNKYAKDLEKMGYKIGGLCADKNNPKNKPFTFCSKSSFEGTDFYSTNAVTVVFLDGAKTSQSLSLEIDLPQIMGRQRLDCNPFRRDATVYYRSKSSVKSEIEVQLEQTNMIESSNRLLESLNHMDEATRASWAMKIRNTKESDRYVSDYVDVFDTLNGFDFGINWLAFVAKTDVWQRQAYYYSNPIYLLSGISQGLSQTTAVKPAHLLDFERKIYQTSSFQVRMKLFVDFISAYPELLSDVLYNPYIPSNLYEYYYVVGEEYIKSVEYREKEIRARYTFLEMLPEIKKMCCQYFIPGKFYTKPETKALLQEIYTCLGIVETAKATDITAYMPQVRECMHTIDGKRISGYQIP